MTSNRHFPGFARMAELTMAASLLDDSPAVGFDQFDDIADLHLFAARPGK
jgi:hypothetical protein